jgi:phasin family protein
MNVAAEQFASANKANVETLLTIANTAFASAERLAALNLNTARAVLEDSVANAKALLAVKDVQQLVAMQATLAQPAVEKAVAYSRSVYEIATQTQEELSKVVESQFSEMNKNVATALDKAAKNAPAGSDVAVAAVKSSHRRRQLGLRQHDQGCQASRRNRRSQRGRRDLRHRQGCRYRRRRSEGQEGRLSNTVTSPPPAPQWGWFQARCHKHRAFFMSALEAQDGIPLVGIERRAKPGPFRRCRWRAPLPGLTPAGSRFGAR